MALEGAKGSIKNAPFFKKGGADAGGRTKTGLAKAQNQKSQRGKNRGDQGNKGFLGGHQGDGGEKNPQTKKKNRAHFWEERAPAAAGVCAPLLSRVYNTPPRSFGGASLTISEGVKTTRDFAFLARKNYISGGESQQSCV